MEIARREQCRPGAGRAAPGVSRPDRASSLHFGEMCVPMCVGFAVGDLVYFWLAGIADTSSR